VLVASRQIIKGISKSPHPSINREKPFNGALRPIDTGLFLSLLFLKIITPRTTIADILIAFNNLPVFWCQPNTSVAKSLTYIDRIKAMKHTNHAASTLNDKEFEGLLRR
jgi:hypothetical protein